MGLRLELDNIERYLSTQIFVVIKIVENTKQSKQRGIFLMLPG